MGIGNRSVTYRVKSATAMSVGAPRRLTGVEHGPGSAVEVLAMAADLVRAEARARELLESGTPVTFVVGCRRCGLRGVEALAALRLVARRTGARLDVRVDDEGLRALLDLAGLADLLEE
jgi:hypothetical protein